MTNTKVTEEAAAYAECVGMLVTAWRYPKEAALEALVETYRLYPITILPSLSESARRSLLKMGIVVLDDLLEAGPAVLAAAGLKPKEAETVLAEAGAFQSRPHR